MNHPIENLLLNFVHDLGSPSLLLEAGVLACLAAMSWLMLAALRRRANAAGQLLLSAAEWWRLVLPGLLLPLLLVGRAVLGRSQNVDLFNLALPLLASFFAIQSALYLLRRVSKQGRAPLPLQYGISWLLWGIVALHISGHLKAVIAAMDGIGFNIGNQHLSLYSVLVGLFSLGALITLALWLSKLVEGRLLLAMPGNANLRLALSKMTRGLLLLVAVLIALPLVGIDITVLSVFGGALGVGLGLGLQKIAANYVSGFTLLLEQSIRIGDMVTVGTCYGEITQIAMRYTVIRCLDGSENIIPNDTLITSVVTNHTLANRDSQIRLTLQVAYDTNLAVARRLMLEALNQVGIALAEPAPQVQLSNFGDNGISLDLVFWINHPEAGDRKLRSDIHWGVWERFSREGIEIPYPQRVVRLAGTHPAALGQTSTAATN